MLAYQQTRKVITDALSQVGLVTNLERATTYSLRRGCATMVAIWADQAEQEANGFWLSKRSSHMPDRYHGPRVQRSLIVKLTNRELLDRARRGARALSWNHWGVALAGLDVQDARETANALEAESILEAWTPKEWAGIPALPISFSGAPVVQAEPKVDSGASSAPTPTVSGEDSEPETSSVSDSSEPESPKEVPAEAEPSGTASAARDLAWQALLDSHSWQATRFKGALHIHFVAAEGAVPRCKQRKGQARAKPLARINACGSEVSQIGSFCPPSETSFCKDCLAAMRVTEPQVRELVSRGCVA